MPVLPKIEKHNITNSDLLIKKTKEYQMLLLFYPLSPVYSVPNFPYTTGSHRLSLLLYRMNSKKKGQTLRIMSSVPEIAIYDASVDYSICPVFN